MAHIGESIAIKGELSGSEDVYLDGELEGRVELLDAQPSPANDPIHATCQYSSGKSRVVADRSASVMVQSLSPASVR
jgi:hypothetical protein